jgi:hypothetical protein
MDLICDLGHFRSHFGITGIYRAIADRIGRCFAGAALRTLLAGGLGPSRGLLFGFFGVAHGHGNASGDKLCRGMQALHSAAGRESL